MPTRFDHTVIAVRDLDAAIERFQRLGFDASPGGRHTGRGSHNALIRFGLDYLELLSIYDQAEAKAFNGGGPTLLDTLNGREAAIVGFALATTNIEEEAQRFKGTDTVLPKLNPMQRKRPDGQVLSWRTLSPGTTWNRPWPFLIQWDTPDEQRLLIDRPGTHPNGVHSWRRIAVATHDLPGTIDIYRNQLGLELVRQDVASCQVASRATFSIGEKHIDLLTPDGAGPVQQIIDEKGEGPYVVGLAVNDLDRARTFLETRGIKFEHEAAGNGKLIIDPAEALGVRLHLLG